MKVSALLQKDPVQKARVWCRKKFLYYFKKGFSDPTFKAWEWQYKRDAHFQFQQQLNRDTYASLLKQKKYSEIASAAVRIESRTNLLFSFEKMAIRDAVKEIKGAKAFSEGLFDYIYGNQPLEDRFNRFSEIISTLPRKQTRVHTWPLQTIFGFIGNPDEHMFLKPRVTQIAAEKYKYEFVYKSKPNWDTYKSLIDFANLIKNNNEDLKPQDYIDLQSFIWVMGSDEYPD